MSYVYEKERERLFTEAGLNLVIKVRDEAKKLLAVSGAFVLERLMQKDEKLAAGLASDLNNELDATSDGFDADGFNVNALLLPAFRQYQHNDCSGFVVAYDHAETQKIVLELMKSLRDCLEISMSTCEVAKSALDVAKL